MESPRVGLFVSGDFNNTFHNVLARDTELFKDSSNAGWSGVLVLADDLVDQSGSMLPNTDGRIKR